MSDFPRHESNVLLKQQNQQAQLMFNWFDVLYFRMTLQYLVAVGLLKSKSRTNVCKLFIQQFLCKLLHSVRQVMQVCLYK